MGNTFIENGDHCPDEIISSVQDGIYATDFSGGQVDITSGKFVFSASNAFKIENGKVSTPLKGITLVGTGADTMKKITMIPSTAITAAMVKTVSSSSLVSVFEKPKFRDFVASADSHTHGQLAEGLHDFLHGDQRNGFVSLVKALAPAKLAKWSLVTLIPNYFHPDTEVFVKPTTAKGVISHFELQVPDYRPMPYWDFYTAYRETIMTMKQACDPALGVSNVAFCGFLMMSSKNAGHNGR